jgi:hypothetical protein
MTLIIGTARLGGKQERRACLPTRPFVRPTQSRLSHAENTDPLIFTNQVLASRLLEVLPQ